MKIKVRVIKVKVSVRNTIGVTPILEDSFLVFVAFIFFKFYFTMCGRVIDRGTAVILTLRRTISEMMSLAWTSMVINAHRTPRPSLVSSPRTRAANLFRS